jgi:rhombotail lipoprotein
MVPAQTYPTFIMSLYDDVKPQRSTPPTAPMRVAVAQVGELVPPQAMLNHLRQNKAMFQRVEGIPAVFDDYSQSGALPTTPKQITRDRVARLQRMTQDLGLDYLFIYGDTVSNYTRENPLQILDLTIVGAFVIPSRQVRANGKAAGALIDARTGSVLFIASADTEQTKMATNSNEDGETVKVIQNARESLTLRLADQLVARTQEVVVTSPMPLGN